MHTLENTSKAPELTVTDLAGRDLIKVYADLLVHAISQVKANNLQVSDAEFCEAVRRVWLERLEKVGIYQVAKSEGY